MRREETKMMNMEYIFEREPKEAEAEAEAEAEGEGAIVLE
jgi:hypothetical protein